MLYYVTFFDSEESSKKIPETPRGQTEVFLNKEPEIGDTITLDFPAKYTKNFKWFSKLPRRPYNVFSIQPAIAHPGTVLFAYYSGQEEVDFDQIEYKNGK